MQRLIIVSNRLPVSVEKRKGELSFKRSVGGVATGLGAFHETHESVWVGWADVPAGRLDAEEKQHIAEKLSEEFSCSPVFLTKDEVRGFYHGFSNRTLWPLFHYFTRYAEFDAGFWHAYDRVNRKYRDAVLEVARPGDIIWVNDYQLMLVPHLIRERMPDATIGFFLHIPFPTFEVFRALPWRRQLLRGLLGSDLVGFHTYDYARYFNDAVRNLLGHEEQRGQINYDDRVVSVDAFPMGIDYDRYAEGACTLKALREVKRIAEGTEGRKVILSIDRLDYTKGIPERLRAFGCFLERNPEWREKVKMIAVAVPSRTRVERYRDLKAEVDELVGSINGEYGGIEWVPIRYMYRSLPFDTLCAMYAAADVALVTPLRDGMNLIAKEYVAARSGNPGVLVLSEMAGAVRELGESIIVNPYDQDEMVEALSTALAMDEDEQRERIGIMQRRLKRYDVRRWAEDFLGSLEKAKLLQLSGVEHRLDEWHRERLMHAYGEARHRLLFLDYDGTLTSYKAKPEHGRPSRELRSLIERLAEDRRNEVVITSGRQRQVLEDWFGDLEIGLVAEHGAWIQTREHEWVTTEPMNDDWKPRVLPVLEMMADRTPGAAIEEKDFSLVWHYRRADNELGRMRTIELREALGGLATDLGLSVIDGNKVMEIRSSGADKGRAAHRWMGWDDIDFVLAIGDERPDEEVFEAAPEGAWTIKVGRGTTAARYSVGSPREVRELLSQLAEVDHR